MTREEGCAVCTLRAALLPPLLASLVAALLLAARLASLAIALESQPVPTQPVLHVGE